MLAAILKCLGPFAPYIAGAAALSGLLLYITVLRHDLATETARNTALQQANQADVAAIAAYQKEEATMNAALDTLGVQTAATEAATSHIDTDILSATPADNAPVAPVLASTLDRLRALQAGTP